MSSCGPVSKMFCGCAVELRRGAQHQRLSRPVSACPGPSPSPTGRPSSRSWQSASHSTARCRSARCSTARTTSTPTFPRTTRSPSSTSRLATTAISTSTSRARPGASGSNGPTWRRTPGKSTHVGAGGRIHAAESTLLDFNRSGVPLGRDRVPARPAQRGRGRVYAQELRALVAELGVSDARLEEGSVRFDANVSIRPAGAESGDQGRDEEHELLPLAGASRRA